MNPATLAQKEDTARWAREYTPVSFEEKHLWYPKFTPFEKLARFAFLKEITH